MVCGHCSTSKKCINTVNFILLLFSYRTILSVVLIDYYDYFYFYLQEIDERSFEDLRSEYIKQINTLFDTLTEKFRELDE